MLTSPPRCRSSALFPTLLCWMVSSQARSRLRLPGARGRRPPGRSRRGRGCGPAGCAHGCAGGPGRRRRRGTPRVSAAWWATSNRVRQSCSLNARRHSVEMPSGGRCRRAAGYHRARRSGSGSRGWRRGTPQARRPRPRRWRRAGGVVVEDGEVAVGDAPDARVRDAELDHAARAEQLVGELDRERRGQVAAVRGAASPRSRPRGAPARRRRGRGRAPGSAARSAGSSGRSSAHRRVSTQSRTAR